jgi:hypothetical protein
MLWHQCSANPSYFKIWNQHLKPALHVVALGEVGSQPELYMVLSRLKKVVPPGMFHGGTLVVEEDLSYLGRSGSPRRSGRKT